jgi:hypothetical protein
MNNIKFITIENPNGTTTEHAIIENAPGEFTSMPKSFYDAQQKQLTESVTDDPKGNK